MVAWNAARRLHRFKPSGGCFRDGRAASLQDQVHGPLRATLKEGRSFYVQRQRDPSRETSCPLEADGPMNKFDDLPAQYRASVNTTELPYHRVLGDAPALMQAEVDGVGAFLGP